MFSLPLTQSLNFSLTLPLSFSLDHNPSVSISLLSSISLSLFLSPPYNIVSIFLPPFYSFWISLSTSSTQSPSFSHSFLISLPLSFYMYIRACMCNGVDGITFCSEENRINVSSSNDEEGSFLFPHIHALGVVPMALG